MRYLIAPCFFFIFQLLTAQTTTSAELAYHAFLNNDLSQWEKAIQLQAQQAPEDEVALAELHYGAIGTSLSTADEEAMERHLTRLEEQLENILTQSTKDPVANALMGGAMGFRIAQKPIRGMTLGRKSAKHVNLALREDENCAMAHYQRGMRMFNTPSMWGGDKAEAAISFQKAKEILEIKEQTCNNWLYLSTLAWLGQALAEDKRPDEAKAVYALALQAEPDFQWVEYVLLPKVK
ncbi:MAG: hypothetical protein AAFU67_00370 [Bacteroidota bacterium]